MQESRSVCMYILFKAYISKVNGSRRIMRRQGSDSDMKDMYIILYIICWPPVIVLLVLLLKYVYVTCVYNI